MKLRPARLSLAAWRAVAMAACLAGSASSAFAQAPSTAPATAEAVQPPAEKPAGIGEIAQFLAGGALGLGIHEGGHLLFGTMLDADPGLKAVHFGPIPFFAITHDDVSPAREYAIAASGFWMQHVSSEWLLTRRPGLRDEHAPVAKGVLAFNVAASVAYATAAFGRFGPYERDTRAMADALGVSEPWVGAMILAPAVLDAWRYVKPDARWAAWLSRAAKVGSVVLVVRAAR